MADVYFTIGAWVLLAVAMVSRVWVGMEVVVEHVEQKQFVISWSDSQQLVTCREKPQHFLGAR